MLITIADIRIHWKRLLRRKLLLFGVFLFVLLCFSAVPSVGASSTWSQVYEYLSVDSLIATSDGGYAFANGPELYKTDEFGIIQWNKTYEGSIWSLMATSDGGYVLSGAKGLGLIRPPIYYAWLAKTDASGNLQWGKTYGEPGFVGANSVVAAPDGGYAFAGGSLLLKTDGVGNMQWNRTFGLYDGFRSLIATPDGGYAIAGSRLLTDDDFLLVKTDSYGVEEWNRTYGEERGGYDRAYSLIMTPDGGYALAGNAGSVTWDFWLVKTDELGNMEWSQTYGGTGMEVANSVVATSDGGYALTGYTESFGAGSEDVWLVKTDAFGNMEWSQAYGGIGDDGAYSVVAASDGGYTIAGGLDYGLGYLVKTDELGEVPEYTSWLAPSLILAAALPILIYKKRLLRAR